MKKLILSLFLLLTVLSFAEIVYITPTGKKYHATKTCKGLVRAKDINLVNILMEDSFSKRLVKSYEPYFLFFFFTIEETNF